MNRLLYAPRWGAAGIKRGHSGFSRAAGGAANGRAVDDGCEGVSGQQSGRITAKATIGGTKTARSGSGESELQLRGQALGGAVVDEATRAPAAPGQGPKAPAAPG